MIVLPNNKNIVAVAKQVDALTDKHVAVIATHSVPEALAALVEYDPNASVDDNEAAMHEALGDASAPARSRRRCATPSSTVGQMREGDWIALARDGVVATAELAGRRGVRAARRLVDDDSEIVTVLVGCDAAAKETERIREHIEFTLPAPRGRVPRRRSAAVPVPRRRGVAGSPRRADR